MTKGTDQKESIYIYDTCMRCEKQGALVYELDADRLLCADCYRRETRRIKRVQPCDNCGATPAVRDPNHRRNEYLCGSCHRDSGFVVNNSVIKRALVSLTATAKKLGKRDLCDAAGYGSDCDDNVKPRGPWGGRSLCDKHGKIPPKKTKS